MTHDISLSSSVLSEQHQKQFKKNEPEGLHSSQSKQDTVYYRGSEFEWQNDWQAFHRQHGSKELETNSTV